MIITRKYDCENRMNHVGERMGKVYYVFPTVEAKMIVENWKISRKIINYNNVSNPRSV